MAPGRSSPPSATAAEERDSDDEAESPAREVRGLERRLLLGLTIAVVIVVGGYAWSRPDLTDPGDRQAVLLTLVSLLSLLAVSGLGLLVPAISRIREGFRQRDATRALLVREANEHAERLEEYSRQLERRNEDLRRFAYVVAHDLREPARTISTHARLAQRRAGGHLAPEVHRDLESAVDAAQHLDRLLGDLLAYATVDQRADELGAVDLEEAVGEALMRLDAGALETPVEVDVEPLPTVQGHRAPLVRLFEELLSNAFKFAPEDETPSVEVRGEAREDAWMIEVEDDGIGMDPRHAERVFSMFERLHRRQDVPGTGAGLSICRRVVELHGGEIELDPKPDEGLRVQIRLPRAPSEAQALEDAGLEEELSAPDP